MRIRTFALLLGVPLLLMGALIVGLRIGEGELEAERPQRPGDAHGAPAPAPRRGSRRRPLRAACG